MSEVINKHSRMPRKLSRNTLRRREEQARAGGVAILNEVNPLALIDRYLAGEKIKQMAKQYGVLPVSIYAFLLRHTPDEWIAAQKAKAFAMKEAGEDGLDDSQDALDVAIAREKLRAGQWDLERVMRKDYGRDEQNITINVVDLGDRLRRSRERLGQVFDNQISAPATVNLAPALPAHQADPDVQSQQPDAQSSAASRISMSGS